MNITYRDWLYNVEWFELPFPLLPSTTSLTQGTWIVFSDEISFSQALLLKLKSYGINCVEVKNNKDFNKLFKNPEFHQNIAGVLYLSGLFAELPKEPSLSLLLSLHEKSCSDLMNVVKTLTQHCTSKLPKLFVTSWSIHEEGDEMALAQWPMTGLCKAISKELPDFKLRQVSFDINENTQHSVDNLFLELFARDKEEQIIWRGEKRLGPRLIRIELPKVNPPVFNKKSTYVITGGLTGLGLGLAKWYISRGATHLVLIDPDDITPQVKIIIKEFESKGIKIKICEKIDLANADAMKAIIDDIKNNMPPLKGISHLADRIDDDLLLNLNWQRFENIFNIKVGGAWNLHVLTKNQTLDHFILFSSLGSTMGPLLRANRSAANAFLDALSHYRKAQRMPVLTINWGP